MAAPIALTIAVHDLKTKTAPLPADLEARLTGSPTKSPEELAAEIAAHAARTSALRKAHLDAVRDRAARESQRAADANARKLRLAASRVQKLQSRLEATATKTGAKKEAAEAEREARRAKRIALAAAVSESRQAADEARDARAAELYAAEQLAQAKHTKSITDVKDKSAWQVKHAIAVAAAQKAREALATAAIAEKIHEKQSAAETRREIATPRGCLALPRRHSQEAAIHHVASSSDGDGAGFATPPTSFITPPTSPTRAKAALHRVLNEASFASETLRLQHVASMARHAASREAHLAQVKGRATLVIAKAAAVAARRKAKAEGTDEATHEARAALYERMVNAETLRLFALKNKYGATRGCVSGETTSAFVVRMDDVLTPRMPPANLTLRLGVVSRGLLSTAVARQKGAAARRLALKHVALQKHAKAGERRAAALTRVAKAHAHTEARVVSKACRAIVTHAIGMGKRAHVLAQEHKRIHAAQLTRHTQAGALQVAGAALKVKCAAATERRATMVRLTAKPGAVAMRQLANASRRDAADKRAAWRAVAMAQRCTLAAANRAAHLAERVEIARKRMKAVHPRREMADEQVKPEYSDA